MTPSIEPAGAGDSILDTLTASQRSALADWFGPVRAVRDHSWPLHSTAVIELLTDAGPVIAKAVDGELTAHHLRREIEAHRTCLTGLGGGLPELLHADERAGILVTRMLPGTLAQGSPWEHDAGVHAAAGRLLRRVHESEQPQRSREHSGQVLAKVGRLLERSRPLVEASAIGELDSRLGRLAPGPTPLVPTHGDFQPRNWLVEQGMGAGFDGPRGESAGDVAVSLIDFGRFEWRPWYSDVVRLHHRHFIERPDLEAAVLGALGHPPEWRSSGPLRDAWNLENALQSLGTVVWATDIGDPGFADEGRGMVERTLAQW